MSDTPIAPVPVPAPAPTASGRTRSLISQTLIDELTYSQQIAATAALPEYAPKLAEEEIDQAFLDDLTAKIAAADELVGGAAGKSADRKASTQREEAAKEALLDELQKIQTRAKRKYKDVKDPMREKYFIGERLINRPMIERATRAILKAVAGDKLPGQKPEGLVALTQALEAYVAAQTGQTNDQAGATTERASLEVRIKEIVELRRDIQYAADTIWPAEKKTHAGIRKAFGLPPTRTLR